MKRQQAKILILTLVMLGVMGLPSMAHAGDDTARFYGTWKTSFPYNGQTVTMVSVHDSNGYKNYIVLPNGNTPAGEGQFSAVNGKWSAAADKPNNSGTYHFLGDNMVVCTNAIGQAVTWRREKDAPIPPATAPPPANAQPASEPFLPPSSNPDVNTAIAAFDKKDYNTAWKYFMKAAQQGDSEGQAGVGAMLLNKINPPGTGYFAQCEKWLLASANQGNAKGMTFLGKYYYADGVNIAGGINPGVNHAPIPPALREQAERRFALARQWFERAANKGDGYAMGNLAIMLDAGVGGPKDPSRAAELRAQVASHSDRNFAKRATSDPGSLAMTAAWQSGHYADALKDAEARAAKGEASAEALLGRAYYEGVGVPRNYATALQWLNRAVAKNNADGMFFLGLMYEHGRGVKQDISKAEQLFDRAASLGQHYAKMEGDEIRMKHELDRLTALTHHNSSTEDIACQTAGGVSMPGECVRGGENIDPYAAWKNESN